MVKVAVLGACGGIGQPLCLLLKGNSAVRELALYDVADPAGVAADLSHINTASVVKGYQGPDNLHAALLGSDVVVIPAGVPRKPGMTRDDLFNINAGIVKALTVGVAKACPKAFVAIISNPVNSTVPIAAEVLKQHNAYDPRRLFGVTTLDVVRASKFVSEVISKAPESVNVSVIGGHSGVTIIPLLSQVPNANFSEEQIKQLTNRIQYGGDEVVKAKNGAGSATLSMAYAGARFVNSLIRGAFERPQEPVVECAFVQTDVAKLPAVPYFAVPIQLGVKYSFYFRGISSKREFSRFSAQFAVKGVKRGSDVFY